MSRNKDITKVSLKNGTFIEEIAIKIDIVKVLHIQCIERDFGKKTGQFPNIMILSEWIQKNQNPCFHSKRCI